MSYWLYVRSLSLNYSMLTSCKLRPRYLEAHLRREPVTLPKYQLLWQFYVKDGQPLRAAEVLAILAESTEYVARARASQTDTNYYQH